ncbi:hypothetical protein N665_0652s0003 [Sinapis alba]|nr:hypothetical protein N665_0652s0003 [Sinapis alba]
MCEEACEKAFAALKRCLTTPPVMAKPDAGDTLYLYIAVSPSATRYPTLERMALAIVTSARKLRPYFQSHSIVVLTDLPLWTILQNANHSGRLSKWAIELSEYDITYKGRPTIKSQVLADFIIKIPPDQASELEIPVKSWILHVDGASSNKGSGIGVHLQSPTVELIEQSFRLGFVASNNEAEYEALIAGLCLAKVVGAKRLQAFCDSQLVASQYSGDYEAKNEMMDAYLGLTKGLAAEFDQFDLTKVRREENCFADALAALRSSQRIQIRRKIPVHTLKRPSITLPSGDNILAISSNTAEIISQGPTGDDWRTPFLDYLDRGILPADKWESRRLKAKSSNYVSIDGKLHRWTANKLLLTCIRKEEAELVMMETHKGEGGNHGGVRSLELKLKTQGHYWPTMVGDCEEYASRCDKCQRHAPNIHSPTELLKTSSAPYPFMRW